MGKSKSEKGQCRSKEGRRQSHNEPLDDGNSTKEQRLGNKDSLNFHRYTVQQREKDGAKGVSDRIWDAHDFD